jgi:hypothetical protein
MSAIASIPIGLIAPTQAPTNNLFTNPSHPLSEVSFCLSMPGWCKDTGIRQRGNAASTAIDTLKLKFATAITEITAPRTQRLNAFSKAGVVVGNGSIAGRATSGVNGVTIGFLSFCLLFGDVGINLWVLGDRSGRG